MYGITLVPFGKSVREAESVELLAQELETGVEESASTQAIFADEYCSVLSRKNRKSSESDEGFSAMGPKSWVFSRAREVLACL